MAFFRYQATNQRGQLLTGFVEAASLVAASATLEEKAYRVAWLKPAANWRVHWFQHRPFERIRVRDIVALTRQFSVLIAANVPVVETLTILSQQATQRPLKSAMAKIATSVEGGQHLSEALAEFPEVFDNFYVSLVRTGEDVGKLDEVLEYLADQKERDYELRSKVVGMLIYPAFILVMLVAILFFMMVFVVPNMLTIITETNVELPLATRLLIGVSNFFVKFWWLILLGIGGAIACWVATLKTVSGRRAWDNFLLRLPIVKTIIQNIAVVRLATSFSILLRGGVDVVHSLTTVADVLGNMAYRDLLIEAARRVDDGQPLAETLLGSPIIPPMVAEMINVGEQTGRVEKVLEDMAGFYQKEVVRSINNLVSLIEPLVIIIMGVGVAVVVAAMILPMYRIVGGL